MNGGGHMLTLSPPAGDPAGTQQEPMQGSSSAGSNDLSKEESEGVWSMDIDQAFQEALEIYPPCGRRKIIISDEGKMYGRNELIARYIKLRCGKTRTRKQVSSHIQVLARKKMRDDQAKKKGDGMPSVTSPAMSSSVSPVAPLVTASAAIPLKPSPIPVSEVKPLLVQQTPQAPPRVPMPAMNPAQFSSISSLPTGPTLPLSDDTKDQFALNATNAFLGKAPMFPMPPGFNLFANSIMNPAFGDIKSFVDFQKFGVPDFGQFGLPTMICPQPVPSEVDVKPTATTKKLTMHDFTAYVEVDDKRTAMVSISEIPEVMEPISLDEIQDKFPESLRETLTQSPSASFYVAKCWANLRFDIPCKDRALFAVDSNYSAKENFEIAVRTQVLSFGKIAIEKVEDFQADDCEDGVYRFSMMNSPMCDFMVTFICNLKTLEDCAQMNAVLENFTILQEVKNKKTDETLMILCFILQIDEDDGCGSQLLRLVP